MGRWLPSALAVAAVLGVAAAAALDSLRGDEPRAASPLPKPPPCHEGQLSLELAALDDRSLIVLRHVRGSRCVAPDYQVVVEVARGQALVQEGNPGGLFAPRVQWERTFRFQPRCDQQGPFSAVVRVGPYVARGVVRAMPCFRTAAEVVAFQRECLRSWNGLGNRRNRELVDEGGFEHGTLFRSSSPWEVERCGVQLVSPDFNRWLLAYRVTDRWWSIEHESRADLQDGDAFYDARPVAVGPGGRVAFTDG